MKKPEYTKEELNIISVWGEKKDSKYDSGEFFYPETDKVITRLSIAMDRKKINEKADAYMAQLNKAS